MCHQCHILDVQISCILNSIEVIALLGNNYNKEEFHTIYGAQQNKFSFKWQAVPLIYQFSGSVKHMTRKAKNVQKRRILTMLRYH